MIRNQNVDFKDLKCTRKNIIADSAQFAKKSPIQRSFLLVYEKVQKRIFSRRKKFLICINGWSERLSFLFPLICLYMFDSEIYILGFSHSNFISCSSAVSGEKRDCISASVRIIYQAKVHTTFSSLQNWKFILRLGVSLMALRITWWTETS